jgi:hypothetical protein
VRLAAALLTAQCGKLYARPWRSNCNSSLPAFFPLPPSRRTGPRAIELCFYIPSLRSFHFLLLGPAPTPYILIADQKSSPQIPLLLTAQVVNYVRSLNPQWHVKSSCCHYSTLPKLPASAPYCTNATPRLRPRGAARNLVLFPFFPAHLLLPCDFVQCANA